MGHCASYSYECRKVIESSMWLHGGNTNKIIETKVPEIKLFSYIYPSFWYWFPFPLLRAQEFGFTLKMKADYVFKKQRQGLPPL